MSAPTLDAGPSQRALDIARSECPQHRHGNPYTSDLALTIRAFEVDQDWRALHVTPATGEVRLATDVERALLPEEVLWHEDGSTTVASSVTHHHTFEPNEHLLACHYQWWFDHLGCLEPGEPPFLLQNVLVNAADVDDDDEDHHDPLIGWALLIHQLHTT